jgi:hypothetical protein
MRGSPTATTSQTTESTHADSEAASESIMTDEIAREIRVGGRQHFQRTGFEEEYTPWSTLLWVLFEQGYLERIGQGLGCDRANEA